MIDWDRLAELKTDIGEEDFADVAFLFVAEIGEHVDRLLGAPTTANAADFHFLRGSAVNLGLSGLAEACSVAEAACQTGAQPDVQAVADMFHASLTAIAPEIPNVQSAA